jgi:hypothetical protein
MTSQHEIAVQQAQGKERGLSGGLASENPHVITQGSPSRVLGLAWRKGFLEGQRIREIAEDDAAGDLFRGKVTA